MRLPRFSGHVGWGSAAYGRGHEYTPSLCTLLDLASGASG